MTSSRTTPASTIRFSTEPGQMFELHDPQTGNNITVTRMAADQARRERVHRVIDESVSRINLKPSQLFLVTGLLRK